MYSMTKKGQPQWTPKEWTWTTLGCWMRAMLRASHAKRSRKVSSVIKFLARNLMTDETFRERFACEARNMARIQHPNVVQVHSFGVHCGWPFFVMEYIDGTTLAHWSRHHPSP